MSPDMIREVKEAIETAQTAASKLLTTVSLLKLSHSNELLTYLSIALHSISVSNNQPSLEGKIFLLTNSLIRVCNAIKLLALAPDRSQINIRGVSLTSIINDVKEIAKTCKTTETFAIMSQEDQDSPKIEYIKQVSSVLDECVNEFSSNMFYQGKETIIELSNAIKITCSVIKFYASKVALKYAWGNDCICEEN